MWHSHLALGEVCDGPAVSIGVTPGLASFGIRRVPEQAVRVLGKLQRDELTTHTLVRFVLVGASWESRSNENTGKKMLT